MLGLMLTALAADFREDWLVRSAGTHVLEGKALSSRTRDAMVRLDVLSESSYAVHRSRQISHEDVRWSDVILCSEAAQVTFIRAKYPEASAKTVTLGQLVRNARVDVGFGAQVQLIALQEPDAAYDVDDPAGGDQLQYDQCASNLWELAQAFLTLVARGET